VRPSGHPVILSYRSIKCVSIAVQLLLRITVLLLVVVMVAIISTVLN